MYSDASCGSLAGASTLFSGVENVTDFLFLVSLVEGRSYTKKTHNYCVRGCLIAVQSAKKCAYLFGCIFLGGTYDFLFLLNRLSIIGNLEERKLLR